ncbi:putative glycerophosphodiester phosphodiesterase GDPD6-like isoform X1 [Ditylenchus destructor]|uniref:Glycerophosphodiester phosphodiesterase GDPD6-like isoform X1 n=1 Tax=Ditylenchus destructor TaxID=166010 RepID=A0AAD4MG43_9BILA|nr:putative glycerophosphodiester phosphodiesterase GDPD6-like isoform X1 [Ditylenchus destructor]
MRKAARRWRAAELCGDDHAEGLKAVAAYAAGIGPAKVMAVKADGTVTPLGGGRACAGLKVHPWTFRAENFFLPSGLRGGINPAGHGRAGRGDFAPSRGRSGWLLHRFPLSGRFDSGGRRAAAADRRLPQDRGEHRYGPGQGGRQDRGLGDHQPGRSRRNAGRKLRKQEAREGRERKKHEQACRKDPDTCGPYQGYRAGDPEPEDN